MKHTKMRLLATTMAIGLTSLLLTACVSVMQQAELARQSDQQRATAWQAYEAGHFEQALAKVKLAAQYAQPLDPEAEQVVEAYDDAALYYYMLHDYANATRHQAIAVLLASHNPGLQKMLPVYKERLGWAFAKYRPEGDFAPIAANPLLLLDDAQLHLVSDARVRDFFYRPAPGPWKTPPTTWIRRR